MPDSGSKRGRSTTEWPRVQAVFHEALEKSESERMLFLGEACSGDAALRREVEELLAADAGAGRIDSVIAAALSLMSRTGSLDGAGDRGDSAASRMPTADLLPTGSASTPPAHIGPYRILETLGSGGMGSVYLAERDDEHYRQQVAIKVMRHGLDNPEILRRLRQERQILAHLDHPNIAGLLDGGNTPEGLPYFVMERVEGEPIHHYCDRKVLTIRQRLELFLQVCSAVQYAHRTLVVHRDLKPSNILVTAGGMPKLLDFGIAKLLDPELADDQFTPTLPGMRLLTPQYASPEQIQGRPLGTASDVYSLGVVLYELLTGHRPHHSDRRAELERMVCDVEPPLPSEAILARAAGRAEVTPAIASVKRGSTPERLRRRLEGDLDTVVLKALHKEPARRYASVGHLADDLRRHLDGLPVGARRDTLAYRGRKFIARNRAAVATAAIVLATIVGLVTFYTLRLGEQRDAAERAAERARQEAERAQREAAKSEQVTHFLTEIFRNADPDVAQGEEATVLEVLDQGAQDLERSLRNQPELLSEMRDVIALVYSNQGRYAEANDLFRRSLEERSIRLGEEHADVATSWQHLGDVAYEERDTRGAAELFRRALDLRLRLFGPDHLGVAASRQGLATALYGEPGRVEESLLLFRQALATRRRLLEADHPDIAETLSSLGRVHHDLGRLEEAEAHLREALRIRQALFGDQNTSVSTSMTNLAGLLAARGDVEEALELKLRVIEIDQKILPETHPNQISNRINLAFYYAQTSQRALALEACDQVVARVRQSGNPKLGARALRRVGDLRRDVGDVAGARAAYGDALAIGLAAGGDLDASFSLMRLGELEQRAARPARAEPYFRRALDLRKRLPEAEETSGRSRIASAQGDLGACLLAQGRLEEATAELCASHRVLSEILEPEHAEILAVEARLRELREHREWPAQTVDVCSVAGGS